LQIRGAPLAPEVFENKSAAIWILALSLAGPSGTSIAPAISMSAEYKSIYNLGFSFFQMANTTTLDDPLGRVGNFCEGVLSGYIKFNPLPTPDWTELFLFLSSLPAFVATAIQLFVQFPLYKPTPSFSGLVTSIIQWNIHFGFWFTVIFVCIIPGQQLATFNSCGVLRQPSLIHAFPVIVFWVNFPFLMTAVIAWGFCIDALRTKSVTRQTVKIIAVVYQCFSCVYQIWFGLFQNVIFSQDNAQLICALLTFMQGLFSVFLYRRIKTTSP
jgi:hypothetical protein